MFIEIRHLRSLQAIQQSGSLARAAETLHLTQSALSHQIKALENYFDTALFLRSTKPLKLTHAGQKLVDMAHQVLPDITTLEADLHRMAKGEAGRLHIAIECHACFEWLLPVLDSYRQQWPEVEVDIRIDVSFNPIPAIQKGEIDLLISSDPVANPDIVFKPLFTYAPLLVAAAGHPLAGKKFIEPADLADQTLITYPVKRERLDIFTRFLQPAGIEPATIRQSELTAVILLLVASQRGVAVLPDWVLRESLQKNSLITRPLGKNGMSGQLYAAVRSSDQHAEFITDFIALAQQGNP